MIAGVVACMSQLFFAWRLHVIGTTRYPSLSPLTPQAQGTSGLNTSTNNRSRIAERIIEKQRYLTTFIIICSFASCLGGIGSGIAAQWVGKYTSFLRFEGIAILWVGCGIIADVTITVAMTYHLWRAKAGFEKTDRLLDRVIQRTFLPASLLSAFEVQFYGMPDSHLAEWLDDLSIHVYRIWELLSRGAYTHTL